MCTYSVSRAVVVDAKQGDALFHNGHGFVNADAPNDDVYVCLRPGTELVLSAKTVTWMADDKRWGDRPHVGPGGVDSDCDKLPVTFEERKVVTTWQGNDPIPAAKQDLLVRADGSWTLVRNLPGAMVKVMQLPARDGFKVASPHEYADA